ncbi:hypothetical protein V12B01_24969 [Vibrio splendidus 12B01]|nr:hypothetical protein V12B01_24969 [Vibrio splendidus 12B01]
MTDTQAEDLGSIGPTYPSLTHIFNYFKTIDL